MPQIGSKDCLPVGPRASECTDGFSLIAGQGCIPVEPTETCPAGTMVVLGQTDCQGVGVPSGQCGDGFSPDGNGGCSAILPATACAKGQMALPGETACHAVGSCGSGTWGDIATDGSTQFVDGSYMGNDSDGTMTRPWTKVQQGIDVAATGATVAVAAGTYAEDVSIDKRISLRGRCAASVQIAGQTANVPPSEFHAAIDVGVGADGASISDLAVVGAAMGVRVGGATAVTLERFWVHDTASFGVVASNDTGDATLVLKDGLLESARVAGVLSSGAQVDMDGVVVRDITTNADGTGGYGVELDTDYETGMGAGGGSVVRSIVERCSTFGIVSFGGKVSIGQTLVRDLMGLNPAAKQGLGISALMSTQGQRAAVTVSQSVVERALALGIYAVSSDLVVSKTTVRDTVVPPGGQLGNGIHVERSVGSPGSNAADGSTLSLEDTSIWGSTHAGIFVLDSTASVAGTWIHDTHAAVGTSGIGIVVGPSTEDASASLSLSRSKVSGSEGYGVFVAGGTATAVDSDIRDNERDAINSIAFSGLGIYAGPWVATDGSALQGATLSVTHTLLTHNRTSGIHLQGATVDLEGIVVRDTQSSIDDPTLDGNIDGMRGAGLSADVLVFPSLAPLGSTVHVRASLFERNHEEGISLNGATLTLEDSTIRDTLVRPADDNGGTGISLGAKLDENFAVLVPSQSVIDHCLVDTSHAQGILVDGADATISATAVMRTKPTIGSPTPWGVFVVPPSDAMGRYYPVDSRVSMSDSLLADTEGGGLVALSSDLTLTGCSILRSHIVAEGVPGIDGVYVLSGKGVDDQRRPATAAMTHVLIDQTEGTGISMVGDSLTLDGSVVRSSIGAFPGGLAIDPQGATPEHCRTTVRTSLFEGNSTFGILAYGGSTRLEDSVVRGTVPVVVESAGLAQQTVGHYGVGIALGDVGGTTPLPELSILFSLVEDNYLVGAVAVNGHLSIEDSIIRGTKPQKADDTFGLGIGIDARNPLDPMAPLGARPQLDVKRCLVEDNFMSGFALYHGDARIEDTLVSATHAQKSDGAFGDGVATIATSQVFLSRVRSLDNERCGLSVFGASLEISLTSLECNQLDLDAESQDGISASVKKDDTAFCGCSRQSHPCRASSSHLEAPTPLPPLPSRPSTAPPQSFSARRRGPF